MFAYFIQREDDCFGNDVPDIYFGTLEDITATINDVAGIDSDGDPEDEEAYNEFQESLNEFIEDVSDSPTSQHQFFSDGTLVVVKGIPN